MTGAGAVRDDAARLRRLPARRSRIQTTPSPSPVPRSPASTRALIVPTATALALLVALAPLNIVGDVARAFMYAGMLVAVGGLAFALVVHDGAGSPAETLALRELTMTAALVALTASVAALGVEIASISGRGLAGVTDGSAVAIVAHNGYLGSVALRIVGLALVAFAAYYRDDALSARLFGAAGIALCCFWCVQTGHEATHGLAVEFAVVLHVLAASIWLGGLVALGITLKARQRASDLAGGALVVKRFSIVMTSTVAVLIAAGIALTCLLIGSVGNLVTTSYGLVLCAKITLALTVVAVAAYNQRRLVPSVMAAHARGWKMLTRTVLLEQSALLVIVSLTAVLVNLDPRS